MIGSIRTREVERKPYMQKPRDWLEGMKHSSTAQTMRHLRVEVMELCESAGLYQIDLLNLSLIHILTFQHRFQNNALRPLGDDLGGRHELDAVLLQLGLIPGTVVAVPSKTVQLPDPTEEEWRQAHVCHRDHLRGAGRDVYKRQIVAVLGTIIPPMVILSVISVFYNAFATNRYIALLLKGMQAGVVAVILDVVFDLGGKVLKTRSWVYIALMVAAFVANTVFDVNVVVVILAAAVFGVVLALVQWKKGGAK